MKVPSFIDVFPNENNVESNFPIVKEINMHENDCVKLSQTFCENMKSSSWRRNVWELVDCFDACDPASKERDY